MANLVPDRTMLPRWARGMKQAIAYARMAQSYGMRPFGCVIEDDQGVEIGSGLGSEKPNDPTCHSEILAIQEACRLRDGLLVGCTLYSTHEPCTMCAGAIAHAKLACVVYGSSREDLAQLFRCRDFDIRAILEDTSTPPRVVSGILRDECVALFNDEIYAAEVAGG